MHAAPAGALLMLGDLPIAEGLAVSRPLVREGMLRISLSGTLGDQTALDGLLEASDPRRNACGP